MDNYEIKILFENLPGVLIWDFFAPNIINQLTINEKSLSLDTTGIDDVIWTYELIKVSIDWKLQFFTNYILDGIKKYISFEFNKKIDAYKFINSFSISSEMEIRDLQNFNTDLIKLLISKK